MHFSELFYSGTSNLTNLEEFSNMCIPGLSLYEISGRTIQLAGCTTSKFLSCREGIIFKCIDMAMVFQYKCVLYY